LQALISGGVPDGLFAAGVIQVHRDDAFVVDVRLVPAVVATGKAVAPAPSVSDSPPIAPADRVSPFNGRPGADSVAHQAVRATARRCRLHADSRELRSDRTAQTGFIHWIRNAIAHRAVALERARPSEGVALRRACGPVDIGDDTQ